MQLQRVRFLWIGFIVLAMLACQLISPSGGGGPSAATNTTESVLQSGPQDTPTFQTASEPLEARLDWFQQDASDPGYLQYCITYTNHDPAQAQFASSFLITAYDANGNELGQTTEINGWVFPGQSLPVAGSTSLTTDGKVARLEVKAEAPGQVATPPGGEKPLLSVENASTSFMQQTTYAVGTLRNAYDKTLRGVMVTALVYDSGGKLIDAESGGPPFIPAGQETAVQIELRTSSEAARVKLYPYLGDSVEFLDTQAVPVTVEKAAALQKNDGLVEAIVVIKNSAAHAYAGSPYNISFYDAQGKAVAGESGEIPFVSASSRVARTLIVQYPVGTKIARMDVQVQPRSDSDWANQAAGTITTPNPLTIEQPQYQPDVSHNNDKVVALVKNNSGQSADSAGVAAVLYNAVGQIVGGGETGIGILPAGGQAQVEIGVNVKGDVAKVEVLPFFYNAPAAPGDSSTQPASPGGAQETSTPSAEAPKILSQWFAHNSSNHSVVDFAFLVENPNPALELLGAEYQAVVYDQAGLTLGSTKGSIGLLPASGRQGVINRTIVKDTDTVTKIEVIITSSGQPQTPANPQPPLQASQVKYTHYQERGIVSGMVSNSLSQEFPGVTINALVFDASGQIIGAGQTFGDYFIPASGQAPVAVQVNTAGMVARAELYPTYDPNQIVEPAPAGFQPLKVIAAGFIQNPESTTDVVAAFVVENPNSGKIIYAANYQVSLYDQSGVLLATASSTGAFWSVYQGSKGAQTAQLNVPRETRVARVDVLVSQGQAKDVTGSIPLQTDKATYIATPYPEVTGLVLNSSSAEIKLVTVCAILYDKDGHIIGGGSTSLDNIPANGQAPVQIMVQSSGQPPAKVELYLSTEIFGMSNP